MVNFMTICMLLRKNYHDDWRVKKEVESLNKRGFHVIVISRRQRGFGLTNIYSMKDKSSFIKEKIIEFHSYFNHLIWNVSIHKFFKIFIAPIFLIVDTFSIIIKAAKQKADVYHCHDYDTLLAGFIVSMIKNKPFLYDSHELSTGLQIPGPLYVQKVIIFYRKLLEKLTLPHAFAVITVNELIGEILEKNYHVKKLFIIRNCPKKIIKIDPVNYATLLHNKKAKVLIYSGFFFPGRGLETVINILPKLNKNIYFVLIGKGEKKYLEKLQELAFRKKVHNRFIYLGYVEHKDIFNYLAGGDCGIFLFEKNRNVSLFLSSPNKLFEYIMAGLPFVSTDGPYFKRIVNQYKLGFAVDENNEKEVIKAIYSILYSAELRKEMSNNCRYAALHEFNWEEEEKKLISLYSSLGKLHC